MGLKGRAALLEAAGWEAAGLLSAPILWGTAPAAIPSCSEPPHVPQRRAEGRAPCRAASSAALRGHRQPPPHRRAALLPGVGLRPWVPLLLLSSAVLWGRPPPVLPLLLLCAAVSRQRVPWRWNSPPPVILHVSLCRRVWSSPGLPQLLVPEQGLVLSSSARGCRCEFGSSLEGRGAPAGGCMGMKLGCAALGRQSWHALMEQGQWGGVTPTSAH